MAKSNLTFLAIVAVLAAVIIWQQRRAQRLMVEASTPRTPVTQAVSPGQELAKVQPGGDQALSRDQLEELLRLRGEVGALRRELAEARQKQATPLPLREGSREATITLAALEQFQQQAGTKAVFAKNWMSAFIEFATENGGQFPTNFEQAARFLRDTTETNVTTDQFEIVYQGSRNDLTNAGDEDLIALRERQAWQWYDGKWGRIYGRIDGTALTLFLKDRDALEQWEKERLQSHRQP